MKLLVYTHVTLSLLNTQLLQRPRTGGNSELRMHFKSQSLGFVSTRYFFYGAALNRCMWPSARLQDSMKRVEPLVLCDVRVYIL